MDSIFVKRAMYRSYSPHYSSITGDLERDVYGDYPIACEIQIQTESDQLIKNGHLKIGDAEGFFKGRYDQDADGNNIVPALIPKNRDEILFDNKWYRIKSAIPEYWTEGNVLMFDCMMVLIEDEEELLPLAMEREFTFTLIDHNSNFIVDESANNIVGKVG